MPKSDNPKDGTLGSLRASDLLKFIQDKDARVGLVLSLFILFLLVSSWFFRSFGSVFADDGLWGLFTTLGWLLVAAAGFIVFFKAIDGTVVPRVIVWYFTIIALMTTSIFWVQAILRQPIPLLIEARCFVDPWGQACPLGPLEVAKVVPPPKDDDPTQATTPFSIPRNNRVFVQFAGTLSRDDVTAASLLLVAEGWRVEGADRGGERTAKAAGVDQVRYFHETDADAAANLARSFNQIANWSGFDPLSVAKVRGYETSVPLGHLEIWTSVD